MAWHTRCNALLDRGSMFKIETNPHASQDDLPPEIERRLQVEELWARRHVLAELMNEERLRVYALRRTDWAADPVDVGARAKFAKLATTVVSIRKSPVPVVRPRGATLSPRPASHLRAH